MSARRPGDPPPEFARYEDGPARSPPLAFALRSAVPGDAVAIAGLDAASRRSSPEPLIPLVARDLARIAAGEVPRFVVVAEVAGEVVAYGRASWNDYAANPQARGLPTGWYFTGVEVDPRFRRRGLAAALASARFARVVGLGATEVRSFTSAENRASVALHLRLGFEEVGRDVVVPGVPFRGGVGILFRREVVGG